MDENNRQRQIRIQGRKQDTRFNNEMDVSYYIKSNNKKREVEPKSTDFLSCKSNRDTEQKQQTSKTIFI